jgi:Secretion system C-terminal sorting domain
MCCIFASRTEINAHSFLESKFTILYLLKPKIFVFMNKLHAIVSFCAMLVLPSMVFATPAVPIISTPTAQDNDGNYPRNIQVEVVSTPSKVPGFPAVAGSVITKVELFINGVLQTVVPTIVVTPHPAIPASGGNPAVPAAPTTYKHIYKFTCLAAGARTFTAKSYENTVPVTFAASTTPLEVTVVDARPVFELTTGVAIICSPAALKYVAPATINATVKVKDDCQLSKVEFYWVDGASLNPATDAGVLKRSYATGAVASGTYTFLYTNITSSGYIRVVAYDAVGNRIPAPSVSTGDEVRKFVTIAPNAAPDNLQCVLTQKVDGADASVGATIFAPIGLTLTTSADDATGTVAKMELYDGNTVIATLTVPTLVAPVYTEDPNNAAILLHTTNKYMFKFVLPATLASGLHTFTIKATDSYGAVTSATCITFTLNKCEDLNEPANNVKTGAVAVANPSSTYAKLASAADVADYYTIPAGTQYIYLTGVAAAPNAGEGVVGGIPVLLPADFDMALYAGSGKSSLPILVSEADGTITEQLDLTGLLISGPYTLKVYGYNGAFSASCYRLRLSAVGSSGDRVGRGKTSTKNTPVQSEMSMELTPNPATNEVTLMTSVDNAGEYNLAVTDVLGREVKRQTLTLNEGNNSTPIDISNINKGMYIVRLWNGQGQLTQKLNIEK